MGSFFLAEPGGSKLYPLTWKYVEYGLDRAKIGFDLHFLGRVQFKVITQPTRDSREMEAKGCHRLQPQTGREFIAWGVEPQHSRIDPPKNPEPPQGARVAGTEEWLSVAPTPGLTPTGL